MSPAGGSTPSLITLLGLHQLPLPVHPSIHSFSFLLPPAWRRALCLRAATSRDLEEPESVDECDDLPTEARISVRCLSS
jgi:hypothetical protein